jgi:hypothetical protein
MSLPVGLGNLAGKIASVFNVGTSAFPPAVAPPPLSIFCGDNEVLPGMAYSACIGQ